LKFEASLGKQFLRPHLQNHQKKMDWCGSNSRVPALQVRSFASSNPRPTKKKRREEKRTGGVAQVVEYLPNK
jgi:hypothetical protein